MKLHYKMFSVSIAFTLNMKTYRNSQEGFLCPYPFSLLLFSSVFPILRKFSMDFVQEYL